MYRGKEAYFRYPMPYVQGTMTPPCMAPPCMLRLFYNVRLYTPIVSMPKLYCYSKSTKYIFAQYEISVI